MCTGLSKSILDTIQYGVNLQLFLTVTQKQQLVIFLLSIANHRRSVTIVFQGLLSIRSLSQSLTSVLSSFDILFWPQQDQPTQTNKQINQKENKQNSNHSHNSNSKPSLLESQTEFTINYSFINKKRNLDLVEVKPDGD